MQEIIHIVPLGFERDRVVEPLRKYPVSRVHLLTVNSPSHGHDLYERQQHYTDLVKNDLEKLIPEVKIHDVDIFDLLETMSKIAKLVREEGEDENQVYVNISGGGRLTSVAATLASMYHDAETYYVKADRYASNDQEERLQHGLSICEDPEIKSLTNFRFERPTEEECRVLQILEEHGDLKTGDILEQLRDLERYDFDKDYWDLPRKKKQSLLMRLNRGSLDKLEEKEYVEREKRGRHNLIKLTESGKYIAHLC